MYHIWFSDPITFLIAVVAWTILFIGADLVRHLWKHTSFKKELFLEDLRSIFTTLAFLLLICPIIYYVVPWITLAFAVVLPFMGWRKIKTEVMAKFARAAMKTSGNSNVADLDISSLAQREPLVLRRKSNAGKTKGRKGQRQTKRR